MLVKNLYFSLPYYYCVSCFTAFAVYNVHFEIYFKTVVGLREYVS